MKANEVIALKNLGKSYGNLVLFQDFNCVFPVGETTVLMGPSGCGKTTLLRILAGLEPYSGQIETAVSFKTAMVFQDYRLLDYYSALENIRLVQREKNSEPERLLALLGLDSIAHKKTAEFSGGMKSRVALARALASDYNLLLLDEPFKGLDQEARQTAMTVCRREAQDKTIILATHDKEEADFFGSQILDLKSCQSPGDCQ